MTMEFLGLLMRWTHILTAIVAVGGSFFMRAVLMPVAGRVLENEVHDRLRGELMARWKKIVHACVALFLLSGFYNFFMTLRVLPEGTSSFHMLFGIKFLLALAVFALAIGLTSDKAWAAGLRAKRPFYLSILLAMMAAIVMISGYLRTLHP